MKPSFEKDKTADPCWYCHKKGDGILTEPNGSEIWCCLSCVKKHMKPSWFSKRKYYAIFGVKKPKPTQYHTLKQETLNLDSNLYMNGDNPNDYMGKSEVSQ